MRKLVVLFVSILLSANFFTLYAKNEEEYPFITRTFPSSSIREVEVVTTGGNISMTGDAGSKAVVEVYVSCNNCSIEKIKQILKESYTIDIKVEKGKLYAAAKQKKDLFNWNQQGVGISFKIVVPKQVNSNLQTSGGNIQICNLSGSQNFKTSGGSLTIGNVSGNIVGLTSGGNITVAASSDNINLKTSGGSISANDCRGKIELKTSGGNLNLSNIEGNISAATSGGSITASNIKGTLQTGASGGNVQLNDLSGNVEASTSGGNMSVRMRSAGDYVRLSNSGDLRLTLPAGKGYKLTVKASNIETSGMKNFQGDMDRRSMEGVVGNGGTEVDLKSSEQVHLLFE
ncbi:MAG: hypothetical protein FWF52_08470 [Candidatus Azobacteroides sp.]|nr:hypothetical protein [Candidatus Azobacteroides sp.]